jgi:hypothetical protein
MQTEPPKADQPSPRRRFQFRLRTLMIGVTLFCVFAGYIASQANIVRARSAMRDEINHSGGVVRVLIANEDNADHVVPWIRTLIRDRAVSFIGLPIAVGIEYRDRVHALFPEAEIFAMRVKGMYEYTSWPEAQP